MTIFQGPGFWIGLAVGVVAALVIVALIKLMNRKKNKHSVTKGVTSGGYGAEKSSVDVEKIGYKDRESKILTNYKDINNPTVPVPIRVTPPPVTLKDNETKYPLKLIEKTALSHDTRRFRFALPSEKHILGLPVGQHIHLFAMIDGELVRRAYTPTSSDDDLGHVDLVVKVYFKNVHPNFPDGGKISQYLNDLPLGQTVEFRGPTGRLIYKGKGEFAVRPDITSEYVSRRVNKINMIAGGSGITPMLQIVNAILKDKNDKCCISMIFANHTEDDILCRSDLEKARDENPGRFKLWYTVSKPPTDWKYGTGFVNEEMIKNNFFAPSDDTIVLMCGPPPMINFACTPNLDKLGYSQTLRHIY